MSRKEAREQVFGLVFEFCFTGERNQLSLDSILSVPENVKEAEYITDVYNGVIENYDSLCEKIAANSNGFSLNRIFKVDLAIMLLASYEFLHYNLPPAVAINEAVNLAKKYSTSKSATFVNGVLASLVKA